MKIGVPFSGLKEKLDIIATDEGEAVAIATGIYLATGKRQKVYMSADGFSNTLNPLTTLVIPYKTFVQLCIRVGRTEEWHRIMNEDTIRKISRQCDDTRKSFK